MSGSISRTMGALARTAAPGSLIVSTGTVAGGDEVDSRLPNQVDRLPRRASRLRTLPGLLLWSRRVTAIARAADTGFVWCGNLRPAATPAKWLRERVGIPYGIMVHGGDLLTLQHRVHQSRIKRSTARGLIGAASVLVANSKWTRDLCEVLLGEVGIDPSPGRVRVVPLGTDPGRFQPGLDTGEVRARWGLTGGPWLLTVARLAPYKGVDVGLRAFARLAAERSDLRYAVAGSGDQQVELERTARELGVGDRVRFLTDVPDADLPRLYNIATVYVGVSRQAGLDVDGFGLAVLDASASGVPVVAGRAGGLPEAVREGETGVVVDPEDAEAVAAAITAILDAPARGKAMGAAGRTAVETFFNWGRVWSDLAAISAEFEPERVPVHPR